VVVALGDDTLLVLGLVLVWLIFVSVRIKNLLMIKNRIIK